MLDRIVREHSYAMSEKVEPTSSVPEPELVLDYDFVRVQMPNRVEQIRRREEEAARRNKERSLAAAEKEALVVLDRRAADDVETARKKVSDAWRLIGLRRRQAVFDFVRSRDLPQVDAMNISLSKSVLDSEIEREERVAGELLDDYRSLLPGHDVFPVFIGMRLRIEGTWGRVIGMNLERCAMTKSGTKGQTNFDWERVLGCFAAGSGTEDAGRGDDNILKKLRFEHQDLWPEDWDFPFVTGARVCVKGRWGVILKITVKRTLILLDGQRKAGDYFWEPILKEQKKLRETGFHDPI
ncbi:MAG TPA: hypothetical protein VE954_29490 [Oligoflexus sp.]|uniref:hypothetical protein n=1 Tax=Oligoflexus sp. TaxID=1971216 RepID=UPI002D58F7FC|nr:hypothetical protein [Oligoflexus sp.]HYX37258.1 hypothetical protein [Oligoflexus sp.]